MFSLTVAAAFRNCFTATSTMEVNPVKLLWEVCGCVNVVGGGPGARDVAGDGAPDASDQIGRALNIVEEIADGRERQVETI